jgi:iron complex transport system ATP-binding protein
MIRGFMANVYNGPFAVFCAVEPARSFARRPYLRSSSEPILELLDATVVKGDRRVLNRVRLTIREGEHTAILGPNGAGKSVLVSLLTHHERALAAADGTSPVRVFGEDRWNVSELRSQLGIVSADLHQRFVAGNSEGSITGEAAVLSGFLVSHGILRYGVVTDDMRRRATEALAAVGATHLALRSLDQMSSGEARRVMLARVLATSPRALVLDEPTTGLDLGTRHGFMEQVRGIVRGGTTLVLITHHSEEIVPEIERVILLQAGHIVADGPKAAVLIPERLSPLFGLPITVETADGYYYARPSGAAGDPGAAALFLPSGEVAVD